jgi:hypothetical protein
MVVLNFLNMGGGGCACCVKNGRKLLVNKMLRWRCLADACMAKVWFFLLFRPSVVLSEREGGWFGGIIRHLVHFFKHVS